MAASASLRYPAPSADADTVGRRLLRVVAAHGMKWRLVRAARGALEGLAACGLGAAALVAFGGRGAIASLPPWVGAVVACVVLLPALARYGSRMSPLDAALSLEHAFPYLQDRVATAVDLAARGVPQTAARGIVDRVMAEATGALDALPLGRALPVRSMGRPAAVVAMSLALLVGAWLVRPEPNRPAAAPAPAPERPGEGAPVEGAGPRLYDVLISITPPAYTGLPTRTARPDAGAISALYGSRVAVSASAEPEELTLGLSITPGSVLQMKAVAPGRAVATFTLTRRATCHVEGTAEGSTVRTGEWTMSPEPDNPPVVRMTTPAGDLTLDTPGPVEVSVAASDDFLVSALGLRCRLEGERDWRSLPMALRPGAAVSAGARINLTSLGLVEGKALLLCAWATDNDTVSGPKTSVSSIVTIRLRGARMETGPPTPTEQAERRQADAFAALQQAAEQFERELNSALQQIEQGASAAELAQMSTRLQEAAQRLQEQAGQVEAAMGQLEARLALDELVTPELAEKVRELHQLMQDALNEDLRRALEELQRALEQSDLQRMEMSLEQAREAQRQFMARLDQTLELLRRARLEAELGRLRRLAEELLARQTELRKRAGEMPDEAGPQARAAEQDQRRLARDTEPLANQVAAAAENAREVSADLSRELDALTGELIRRDPSGEMRQAAGALGRGRPSSARDPQQRAIDALQLAAARLAEAEQAVSQDMRSELTRAVAELLRDALRLSQSQEDTEEATRRLQEGGGQDLLRAKQLVGPLRRQQEALAQAVERLAGRMDELARRTPMMDPTLGRDVAAVAYDMMQAAREIDGARLAPARSVQQEAVARLNDAARRLMDLSDAMGGASAQDMLSEYMKRLQQLAERQQGLNEQTGQAGEQGRQAGQGQGSSLAQLAFEQAMIRAALEQMIRGARGGNDQVADQLGGVPGEMEKVEGDLRSGRLERETLERQGRILQKMLDAQRSLYTREPEQRERRAERPRAYDPPPPPPPLSPGLSQRRSLRLSPQPARPRLPEGFEDMVQAYFERLGAER